MKQSGTWPALAILVVAIGMLGLAGKVVFETPPTATATLSSRPARVEEGDLWDPLGGPYERVTYALTFVPDTQVLYAGTWGHGVYSSPDDGQTWERSGTGGGQYINALATLPSSGGQVIYAGTPNAGLFWSTDGGYTWKQLGGYSDFRVQPDPGYPARDRLYIESLLVLSDQGREIIFVGTHDGVWSSGAQSDTWVQAVAGFANTDGAHNVQALAQDPAGRLYAGTEDGLYCSQSGSQWQPVGPPDGYPGEARHILSLAVVTNSVNYTGTLLIGTREAGVYTFDVESKSWLTCTTGFPGNKRARTIQALLSTSEGMAYAGTVDYGVFETSDGGQTWRQRVDGLPPNSRSILSLVQDPASGTLYAGTYGDGVYRLRAGDGRWEPARGISEPVRLPVDFTVQKIVFAGPDGKRLLAGLKVGGLYSNTIQQEAMPPWQRLPGAIPIGPGRDVAGLVVAGPDRNTVVLAAGTGISTSTDAGETWTWHHLSDSDVKGLALAQGRQNPDIIYAALDRIGVYRSQNAGMTWKPASGDLDPALYGEVCCLEVGASDNIVYLGLQLSQVYTRQVYVTRDAGATWQSLSPIGYQEHQEHQELEQLEWSQRSAWDVLWHGGQRWMLYARTIDGIYASYDEGQSWQLRMRRPFSALAADPYRPWVVYVASPGVTLLQEFAIQQIDLTPDLWSSHDGGETWTWVGPGPSLSAEEPSASITTLAFDPNDKGLLYAGTEGAGIFRADLSSVIPLYRPLTLGGLVLLLGSIVLMGGGTYVLQTGLTLGRTYRLPPQTWPALAYLRTRHANELGLVSDLHTPLASLERLVLAFSPHKPFRPEDIRQQLESIGTPTPIAQVEMNLNRLALDYRLLHRHEEDYQLIWPLLGQVARARFWDTAAERERLVSEVRGESQLRADARHFFTQAGFDVSSFGIGFKIKSNQPEYALLGADQGIYVHLHTATTVDKKHIEQVREAAERAYEGRLAGRVAFLAESGLPCAEAYQCIALLRHEEDLGIVLFSHSSIRQLGDAAAFQQQLGRNLRRALGEKDLFWLESPALAPFDFFGRETAMLELLDCCRGGQIIGLGGMSRVGKTSLVRQAMNRLPQAVVAWIDWTTPPRAGLYTAVRQAWLADARLKFPQWEQPRLEPLPEQPAPTQIRDDLGTIRESLHGLTSECLTVVLDGLAGSEIQAEEVGALVQAVALAPDAILVGVFEGWPEPESSFHMLPLRPFREATTAAMIDSLAAQMGVGFEPVAVEQLHLASGGHPLILRQLASLTMTQGGGSDWQMSTTDVEKAVAQYVSQPNPTLSHLWNSLKDEEQQVLLAATKARLSPDNDVLTRLLEFGWLCPVDGRWRLFSQALERWLHPRLPQQ